MSGRSILGIRAACLIACLALFGCGRAALSASPEKPAAHAQASETLHIWVADAKFADEILDGCRYWNAVGVRCVLVAESRKADVRFEIRRFPKGLSTKCVKVARALAHVNGTVEIDLRLFMEKGVLVRKRLVATIAHETGHELGLNHVPLSCDIPDAEDDDGGECSTYDPGPIALPDGSLVCGPGIMNAYRPEDFRALTQGDIWAFRIRDPAWRKTDPPREP